MAYRNVYYDTSKQCMHLWTWAEDGRRIKLESSYEPYLYIETAQGTDAVSIFGTPLKKVKFKNQFERNRFVQETSIKRLFHNISAEQDFLLNTFKDDIKNPGFGLQPLKIFWLDIEVYSPDKFPEPKQAEAPINLITIYDTSTEKYYTWGQKPYVSKEPNAVYFHFARETDMLQDFLKFWERDHPDMLVGWNSEGFDVPYIMNRIGFLFGAEEQYRLSPVNNIYYRENVGMNKFGKVIDRWYIRGVSNIDYLEVYKTFSREPRESYNLGYIGEQEKVGGKTDTGGANLAHLSVSNWELFVDYNIQDVKIMVKLDEKLKLIRLIRNLSYKGFIPFEQSLGKVSMITGAVAHQALMQGYRIPTFKNTAVREEYIGGYVHEPERGFANIVSSWDANSLYPNTIITLNISPETKIGKVLEVVDGQYTIKLVNERVVTLPEEKYLKLLDKEQLSISEYNVLYTQKFKGVIPNLIDRLYAERVEAKTQMMGLIDASNKCEDVNEKKTLDDLIFNLDTQQNVLKLILNSIYGVFAQKYSPLFDIDHSASITCTGQAVVKQAAEMVYQYCVSQGFKGPKKDIYKYGDTDSLYVSLKPLFDLTGATLVDDKGKITTQARTLLGAVDKHINDEIKVWARKQLRSTDPRFVFKQESTCDVALFQEKKRYILHVLESEGKPAKKPFKYVGVEVARSTYSEEVKKLIKSVIESSMLLQNKKEADALYRKAFEKFCSMDIEHVSIRSKISDIEKQEAKIDAFGRIGKGTPVHAKSAIYFNTLIGKLELKGKYDPIGSGEKIKYFYASRNNYNYKTMAFKSQYPPELNAIVKVDFIFMFEKLVTAPIERFYQCIGWHLPQVGKEVQTDLFEFFQ